EKKRFPTVQQWSDFRNNAIESFSDTTRLLRELRGRPFSSSGASPVFSSPLYPGSDTDGLSTLLTVFPGFEFERTAAMVTWAEDRYGADRKEHHWILPRAASKRQSWRTQALRE